jgi:hypothetical protein
MLTGPPPKLYGTRDILDGLTATIYLAPSRPTNHPSSLT